MATQNKRQTTARATANRRATTRTASARDARKSRRPMHSYIQDLYNRSAPLLICEAALLSIASIFMVFRPIAMLSMMTFIIGVALILFGLYRTVAGFVMSGAPGGGWLDVIFGLVNIVLGVLFCMFPGPSYMGVVYVFIALLLFKAIKALIFAINMARARAGHYAMDLTVAIVLFLLAIGLMFFPIVGAVSLIYIMALVLLMYAASDIYMFVELVHLKNQVRDE
ncbi:hypothetical protein HDR66_02355 [bacterium]|nr:hypothetical protein [bacterium]